MTNNKEFFQELNVSKSENVTIADGKVIKAKGVGKGFVHCYNDEGGVNKIILNDVLYVPELDEGLISVRKITEKGFEVKFKDNECKISNADKVIAIAKSEKNVYKLKLHEPEKATPVFSKTKESNIDIWHRRLGHREYDAIKKLEHGLATGIKLKNSDDENKKCECCIKGKLTQKPYPKHAEYRSTQPLELIHSDICGPMKCLSLGKRKYFITFIDDFSRYTTTYVISNKGEALQKLKEFVATTSNMFGRKPKILRSDNGGEYINKEMEDYLRKNGIEHQVTVPYSPQQNGVAERKNRYIMEMTRCMLVDSNLNEKFWGEAVITATYIQNRLPSKSVEKTPYELWKGRKPNLKHLRVFGSKVFCYIPKEKRTKLDEKAEEGIFVGYSDRTKGYRVYVPTMDKVILSRSVEFDETEKESKGAKENKIILEEIEEINDGNYSTVWPLTANDMRENIEQSEENNENEETDVSEENYQEEEEETRRRSSRSNKGVPPIRLAYKSKGKSASTEPNNRKEVEELPPQEKKEWIGEDYEEIYAPTVKYTTIRTLLKIAALKDMHVHHVDVKTAYLHSELKDEIYMLQPDGYIEENKKGKVCKLNKSIYGLKQTAREWNNKISETLKSDGFQQGKADQCLFSRKNGNKLTYVIIYTDDILIASSDINEVNKTKNLLKKKYEITDLGQVRYYLGIEIERNEKGDFLINQKNKIKSLVKEHNLEDAKPINLPISTTYLKEKGEEDLLENNNEYRSIIGSLLYLATISRPDISAAVSILSRRVSNPRARDLNEALKVIKYLKHTQNYQLNFSADEDISLKAYTDADWASNPMDRKSTSGYIFLLGQSSISWTSKKQSCVALSTTESEFIAASLCCTECQWIQNLLKDSHITVESPTIIYEDNQPVIELSTSNKVSNFIKHVDIKFHNVKDLVQRKVIQLQYCASKSMKADFLTKPVSRNRLEWSLKEIQLGKNACIKISKGC